MIRPIWIMGRSGAGKTTLAESLTRCLFAPVLIETDRLRKLLSPDLGWTKAERIENARRYAALALYFAEAGNTPVVVCSTPLEDQRRLVRAIIPALFIYLDVPIEVCRERSKERARIKGQADYYAGLGKEPDIIELAGVTSPYEVPAPVPGNVVWINGAAPFGEVLKATVTAIMDAGTTTRTLIPC